MYSAFRFKPGRRGASVPPLGLLEAAMISARVRSFAAARSAVSLTIALVAMLVAAPLIVPSQAQAPRASQVVRDLAPATTPESVGVSSERLRRMEAGLKKVVDDKRIAGLVTVLERHGKVVSYNAWGVKDVRKPDPVTKDSIFRIYSMSKPVTGVAMMMLYEEGKWRMDDPVSRYIPEFARLKVDVIVTVGSAVAAAVQASSTIPIVFAIAVDPLGSGMVASLSRPGGNVTGISTQTKELAGKRIELLRQALPNLRRLAIIGNVSYSAGALEIAEVKTVASKLGIDVEVLEIRRAEDIAPAFGALKSGQQVLYVCADALINANIARINTLALGARLPTLHPFREYLGAGGLMSYGPKNADLFRQAGDIVDKILKGAKPADLPVEQPTKFELVVNLTAAKALGLTIPETFLLRADEVIE